MGIAPLVEGRARRQARVELGGIIAAEHGRSGAAAHVGAKMLAGVAAAGPLAELAQRSLGLEAGESYTLEEIYMKYFKEG